MVTVFSTTIFGPVMTTLAEPFTASFVLRALVGGVLLAAVCALTGVWVIEIGRAHV